MALLQVE